MVYDAAFWSPCPVMVYDARMIGGCHSLACVSIDTWNRRAVPTVSRESTNLADCYGTAQLAIPIQKF